MKWVYREAGLVEILRTNAGIVFYRFVVFSMQDAFTIHRYINPPIRSVRGWSRQGAFFRLIAGNITK
jgi:hypothetical protein